MLHVHLFSHRKKTFFRSPLKSHPKQSHRCHESDFNKGDPCNYHKVASATSVSFSAAVVGKWSSCGFFFFVLFPQAFRRTESSPFRHIRDTVRHCVLVVVFEFCCQINGLSRGGWNGVKHHEKTTCWSAENQRCSQHWLPEETWTLQSRLAYSPVTHVR